MSNFSSNTQSNTQSNTIRVKKNKCKCAYTKVKKHKKCAILYECLCGKKFCPLHRLPEHHECDFDHKTHSRQILEKNNPKIVYKKIADI